MTTYHAVRVDHENNGDEFWADLRENLPHVAKSLEKNDCVVVSHGVLMRLDSLGAFNGTPSPLIDYGSEGDGYGDVVSGKHEVIHA